MQPNPRIQEWKSRLESEFKRKSPHWTYAELSGLTEVISRPDADSELDELLAYRSKAGGYFPRSIEALFHSWSKTLDQSRNGTDNKINGRTHSKGFNRNAGTAHEGTAHKYSAENRAKLKAVQASQQVPKNNP